MKSIIIFLITAVCFGCDQTTTRTVYAVDVTEEGTPEVTNEAVSASCPESLTFDGHITRYLVLSNTEYAECFEYALEPENEYLSNHGERQADIDRYCEQISSFKHNDSIEYVGSHIWKPLCHELEYLGLDSTIATTIYVISDLLEFNDWMDMYDKEVRNLLKHNPDEIRKKYSNQSEQLGYYNHIDLILVHEPSMDTKENELYALIVEQIYKPILEEHGIRVSVEQHIAP